MLIGSGKMAEMSEDKYMYIHIYTYGQDGSHQTQATRIHGDGVVLEILQQFKVSLCVVGTKHS